MESPDMLDKVSKVLGKLELVKLMQEFRKSPFRAAKALIIFAVFIVVIVTQWAGYEQSVSYGWMLCGLVLIVLILSKILRMAYKFDLKRKVRKV